MAVRKFIICIGQSNGAPIGDVETWEDANPQIALRSSKYPATQLPQFAQGAYHDRYRLPYDFPGGPQTGQLGLLADVNGQWQTPNYRGVAVQQIRFLTLFNPISTWLTTNSYTFDYPGTGRLASGSTPTRLQTNILNQPAESTATKAPKTVVAASAGSPGNIEVTGHGYVGGERVAFTSSVTTGLPGGIEGKGTYEVVYVDADNFTLLTWPGGAAVPITSSGSGTIKVHAADRGTITRLSTGTTHTACCGGPGTLGSAAASGFTLNIDPPFYPAPAIGEQFEYQLRAASGDASRIVLETRMGGLADGGHLVAGGAQAVKIRKPDGDHAAQVICRAAPYWAGKPIQFSFADLKTNAVASVDTGTEFITTLIANAFVDGDLLELYDGGSAVAPGGLSLLTPYYVVNKSGNTFQLALTRGGSAINLTSTGSGAMGLRLRLPSPLATATTYYVTRRTTEETITVAASASTVVVASDKFDLGVDYKLVNDERVVLTGDDVPEGLVSGQTYYVLLNGTADEFQLSEEPGGSAVTITDTGSGTFTLERLDSRCSWFLSTEPFGVEIKVAQDGGTTEPTATIQATFRGSLTGMTLRCTSGSRTSDGAVPAEHIEYDVLNDTAEIRMASSFSGGPSAGDVFVVEPPVAAWKDWAMLLPWCPFEGRAQGNYPLATVTVGGSIQSADRWVLVNGVNPARLGAPFKLYTTGRLPYPLEVGKTYWINTLAGVAIYLSDTYGDQTEAGRIKWWEKSASSVTGSGVTFGSAHTIGNDERVVFYGDDCAAVGITAGTTYYAIKNSDTELDLATSSGGSAITLTPLATATDLRMRRAAYGTHYMLSVEQEGKFNPNPPGFNYPNHVDIPAVYQPYDGPMNMALNPKAGHAPSTALRIAEFEGEVVDVIQLAFGGTTLAHNEITPDVYSTITDLGWCDRRQMLSWAPGEPNGCYAVFQDRLRQLKACYDLEGDTGECAGIFWVQGESDATVQAWANRYEANLLGFKEQVRADIKANGLCAGDPNQIPFVQSKVYGGAGLWPFRDTVNAAIQEVADSDPHMLAVEVTSLSTKEDDLAHYTGASMSALSDLLFEAWKALRTKAIDAVSICNLALRNIGEQTRVTSIAPSDGSLAADLCAEFYPIALDNTLARHQWDFSQRRKQLTAETASNRTEWLYAYRLPGDFMGVVSVLPADPTDDTHQRGRRLDLEFTIETDVNGDRRLFCNEPNVVLRYQARVTDTAMFSSRFKKALAWDLAAMLAPPMVKGEKGLEAHRLAMQMAEVYVKLASDYDADTTREKRVQDTAIAEYQDRGAL